MTKFATNSFEVGEPTDSDAGARDRKRYRFWWEHALRDVRCTSASTWAQKIVQAYVYLHDERLDQKQRTKLFEDARACAIFADGRFVGDWSTETCCEMGRRSMDTICGMPVQSKRTVAQRRAEIEEGLRMLGSRPSLMGDKLRIIGESMLERIR